MFILIPKLIPALGDLLVVIAQLTRVPSVLAPVLPQDDRRLVGERRVIDFIRRPDPWIPFRLVLVLVPVAVFAERDAAAFAPLDAVGYAVAVVGPEGTARFDVHTAHLDLFFGLYCDV